MIFRVLGLLLRWFLSLAKPTVVNLGLFCRRFKGGSKSTVVYVNGKKIKQRNKQYKFVFPPSSFSHMDAALKSGQGHS